MNNNAILLPSENGEIADNFFSKDFHNIEVKYMTDNEIVSLFWERNEGAISAVSEKYGKYCAKIARNILHNEQETEECVNDTYMRAWEKIPPEKPKMLSAFIAKLTRNMAIDKYRHEHAEKRGGGEIPLILEELGDCISDGISVEATAERREIISAINKFLGRLSSKNRIIFVSRYCYCESAREISLRFGISENSVCVSLSRTRKALREYLIKEGFEL